MSAVSERRDQQRAPEADIGRERVGEIAADDQEAAMREVDDVAQVEDQRQAERHQHIERADDQAVGDVEEEELEHRRTRSASKPCTCDARRSERRCGAREGRDQAGNCIVQPVSERVERRCRRRQCG